MLIFCHLLLHPSSSDNGGKTLLWNFDEVFTPDKAVTKARRKDPGVPFHNRLPVDRLGTARLRIPLVLTGTGLLACRHF